MVFKNIISRSGFFLMLVLLHWQQTFAANVMSIQGGQVATGSAISVQVNISNNNPFTAFQLDIPLPEHLHFVAGSAQLSAARASGHSLSAQVINGNVLRIIAFSLSNTPFLGAAGPVMSFQLMAGTLPGNFILNPVSPIIAGTDGSNILTASNPGTVTILASNIQVAPNALNFGEIPLKTFAERSLVISNQGNQTLTVSAIRFDSPYFALQGTGTFSIDAGGSRQITVRFTPQVKGQFTSNLTINSNDPDAPVLAISLEAMAYAVNELHTGSMISFSGQNDILAFSINNMEPFVAFQFDLLLPDPLSYISGSAKLSGRKTDHQVSAAMINHNTLRVVAFSPSNKPFTGSYGQILELGFRVFGRGGWYPLNLSQVIITDLSGINIASASYNGSLQVAAPDIHSASSIAFGDVSIVQTVSRMLRIFNHGTKSLTIENVLSTNAAFYANPTLPINVPTGGFFDLEVFYHHPEAGNQSGRLRILSDDPDENPYEINLSANSFVPNYIRVQNTFATLQNNIVFVDIHVDNHNPFVALEFRLHFPPQVMTFLPGKASSFLTGRAQGHELVVNLREPGVLHVFAFSLQQHAFTGNSGAVVRLGFALTGVEVGMQYPLNLGQAILANSQGQNVLYASQNGFLIIEQVITCPNNKVVCLNATPFALTGGIPAGGIYSGPGVSSGIFNPTVAGTGVHEITYTFSSVNGFTQTCKFEILVDLCTYIDELTANFNVVLFPNPAQNEVNIRVENHSEQRFQINLYDNRGKLKYASSMQINTGSYNLNTSFLTPGIYFVEIVFSKGNIVKKLIIQ